MNKHYKREETPRYRKQTSGCQRGRGWGIGKIGEED